MVLTFSLPGQAAMVSTANIQADSVVPDISDIASKRQWIKEQLVKGGVSEINANLRVRALIDTQVTALYQRINEKPAGGSAVGLLVLVLLYVFLVNCQWC